MTLLLFLAMTITSTAPVTVTQAADGPSGLLPYTVAVKNSGSAPITGLDLLYTAMVGGKPIHRNFFYSSPDLIADKSPLLLPGQEIVLSPDHKSNMAVITHQPSVSPQPETITFFQAAQSVEMSVDLVILAGGQVEGPDLAGTLHKLQQTVDTYRKFRQTLLTRLQGTESDASLTSWLQQETQIRIIKRPGEMFADRSLLLKRQIAQEYLGHLKAGRRAQAVATLREYDEAKAFPSLSKLRRVE
jgi:hypothetical protein